MIWVIAKSTSETPSNTMGNSRILLATILPIVIRLVQPVRALLSLLS
jgi:hypothetical protein